MFLSVSQLQKLSGIAARRGLYHRSMGTSLPKDPVSRVSRVIEGIPPEALTGNLADFRDPKSSDLLERGKDFFQWQDLRRSEGLWPYSKSCQDAPKPACEVNDDSGNAFYGINFASQDYLNMSSNPTIKDTAVTTIETSGVHSAGSSALLGNTKYSLTLERTISNFLQMEHTLLFPTGWAAGFGAINGLVRPRDHVVMDVLSHNCLQVGAYASTRNVHVHGHLNLESARRKLEGIRSQDTENGILVVTESLFSMDSTTPDIVALQDLCREFGATLMVDVAHDLGNIGEDGTGHIGLQGMLGKVDIVMGSFSKTFASNGGFVSVNSRELKEYLQYNSSTCTFSNALSPVQAATVQKAFDIVQSSEGLSLRRALMENSLYLRSKLTDQGLEVFGGPSAIVSVKVGEEALARLVSKKLQSMGVVVNLVEYPAVAKGAARLRLQLMANHTKNDINELTARLSQAMSELECPAQVEDAVAA
jgi:glycine C-acetyltransferase